MPNCMPFPYTYPAHLSNEFLEAKCDTMNFPHNFAREPEVFFTCFQFSVYECRRKTLIAIFSFAHFVAEPGSFYGCSGASPPKCKTVWRTPGKYLQPVCVCVCVVSVSLRLQHNQIAGVVTHGRSHPHLSPTDGIWILRVFTSRVLALVRQLALLPCNGEKCDFCTCERVDWKFQAAFLTTVSIFPVSVDCDF